MFSFHSSLVSFICSHSWRPLHTAVQLADVAVHEGPESNQTLNQCLVGREERSQRFFFFLRDFAHKVQYLREDCVKNNQRYWTFEYQQTIQIATYSLFHASCFCSKETDTHVHTNTILGCHRHLFSSWWLQKAGKKKIKWVGRISQSCRVTAWVILAFTTVPLRVGFLLNSLSQLAIIRPNKTSADFLSARVFLFRKTHFRLNATLQEWEEVVGEGVWGKKK